MSKITYHLVNRPKQRLQPWPVRNQSQKGTQEVKSPRTTNNLALSSASLRKRKLQLLPLRTFLSAWLLDAHAQRRTRGSARPSGPELSLRHADHWLIRARRQQFF